MVRILAKLKSMFHLQLGIKFVPVYMWFYMLTMCIMLAVIGTQIIFSCTEKRRRIQEGEVCWETFLMQFYSSILDLIAYFENKSVLTDFPPVNHIFVHVLNCG